MNRYYMADGMNQRGPFEVQDLAGPLEVFDQCDYEIELVSPERDGSIAINRGLRVTGGTDFRKFDGVLRMVMDGSEAQYQAGAGIRRLGAGVQPVVAEAVHLHSGGACGSQQLALAVAHPQLDGVRQPGDREQPEPAPGDAVDRPVDRDAGPPASFDRVRPAGDPGRDQRGRVPRPARAVPRLRRGQGAPGRQRGLAARAAPGGLPAGRPTGAAGVELHRLLQVGAGAGELRRHAGRRGHHPDHGVREPLPEPDPLGIALCVPWSGRALSTPVGTSPFASLVTTPVSGLQKSKQS